LGGLLQRRRRGRPRRARRGGARGGGAAPAQGRAPERRMPPVRADLALPDGRRGAEARGGLVTARERLDAIEALLADVREDADLAAEPSYTTANIVSKHLAEKRTLQEHVPAMRAALAALVAEHLAQPQPDLC